MKWLSLKSYDLVIVTDEEVILLQPVLNSLQCNLGDKNHADILSDVLYQRSINLTDFIISLAAHSVSRSAISHLLHGFWALSPPPYQKRLSSEK